MRNPSGDSSTMMMLMFFGAVGYFVYQYVQNTVIPQAQATGGLWEEQATAAPAASVASPSSVIAQYSPELQLPAGPLGTDSNVGTAGGMTGYC